MSRNPEEKKTVGLLPMGLAETNKDGRNSQRCHPILNKILAILFIISFFVGFYVLFFVIQQTDGTNQSTKIILLSELKHQNMSISNKEMEIILQFKNKSSNSNLRKKRETITLGKNQVHDNTDHIKFKDNHMQKARKLIAEHDVLCNDENHKEICHELVMKIKSLTENNFSNHRDNKEGEDGEIKSVENIKHKTEVLSTDVSKRETNPLNIQSLIRTTKNVNHDMFPYGVSDQLNTHTYPRDTTNPQLTDSCLLNRLMRQTYSNLHGVYDSPHHHEYHPMVPSYNRHLPSDIITPFLHSREVEAHKHNLHPQDIEIAMKFIAPQHDATSKEMSTNSSVNVVECPIGTVSCDSGSSCIIEKQWCDGNVDCDDVSDESRCNCKSRVDHSRICDGYFDCPFGEDEMGCYGCSENTFSCEDVNMNSQSTCYSKEQRCNNVADCPNHKDEIDCSLLAPSLHKKPLFSVSNTEGYLHRNYKGNWYAVCSNPYMWAHDACRRETGLIIRPPYIQVMQIDPLLKVNYINTAPGGFIHTSNTCLNSSAVYVTCPDLLCGTRVLTSSQMLRDNSAIENLFGRNKRFLQSPRPIRLYDRMKRYAPNKRDRRENTRSDVILNYLEEVRNKRAESRVVGGKPSQPAAWPWMVAMYRDGMFHCGGVIINQNWVMSAAHCVTKFWQHYFEIQVGMLRRFSFSPQEQNHRVTHVIVNQNYDQENMKNDLSLLRVKPGIQFSRWVRPICLPSPEVAGSDWMWGPKSDTTCVAVGWGATVEKGPDPDHMREVEVPIWENCKHEEDQAGREICAGVVEGGKDACQGDSGGPLLCRNPMNAQQWYVAGIVSHGDGCGRKDEPGVYTRVSLFVQWIRYHTSIKTLPLIQPKQECPGFRCDSGISKCLPKKRMCDKIIDCLDGEDELNCDPSKLPEESEQTNMIDDSISITEESNALRNNEQSKENLVKIANEEHNNDNLKSTEKTSSVGSKNNGKIEVIPHENVISKGVLILKHDVALKNKSITNNGEISNEHITSTEDVTTSNFVKSNELERVNNDETSNTNVRSIGDVISNHKDKSYLHENSMVRNNDLSPDVDLSNEKIIDVTSTEKNSGIQIEDNNGTGEINVNSNPTFAGSQEKLNSEETNLQIDSKEKMNTLSKSQLFESQNTTKPSTDVDKINSLTNDLIHASTIEIPNEDLSKSIENEDILDENVTVDPIESGIPNEQLDKYTIDIVNSKYPIDSMSSTLENIPNEDENKAKTENKDNKLTPDETSLSTSTVSIRNEELTAKNIKSNDILDYVETSTVKLKSDSVQSRDSIDNEVIIKNNPNNRTEKDSNELIIELLPNHKVDNDKLNEFNNESLENTTKHQDQIISESKLNQKIYFQKPLDSKEDKSKMDIIMQSELQPAKIRKKHLTPMEFHCTRIYQIVPSSARCDHKADCEDGTDELDCTCVDYLTTFDNNLICDGSFDCADGQDETDCYSCDEDHFLCKRSEICLPSRYVCDGKPQCPLGEDELDCFALSNGKQVDHDINGRPKVSLEGYLTKKHNKEWHIVCEDDMTIHQQEETASRMCRYLGFSSANRYLIKYINLKENLKTIDDNRIKKRDVDLNVPVHFAYKSSVDEKLRAITNPEIIKEECVPNITKVCMTLYIYCDHSLFTDFNMYQGLRDKKEVSDISKEWPWIAKLYIDGKYKCTGVLIDLSWVLISHYCLHGVTLGHHYLTVLLGSHKTLGSTLGPYEQIHQVDAKKDLYRSKVILLHLRKPSVYSPMVKPMVVMTALSEDTHTKCITVGQDKHNKTFSVFLKETDDCDLHHRCFIRIDNSTCHSNLQSHWAGIISCHSKQGWYPTASFVEAKGECAFADKIIATDIGNLKHEIKYYEEKPITDSLEENVYDACEGVRCRRGMCIKLQNLCDGVRDCEDGVDESKESCDKKFDICGKDPHYGGCECPVGQLKCHNGRCIAKELFKNGHDDCGDGTDEPKQTMCSDYLRRVMPSRLCDGVLHCHDRSDEDPMFCKCFAKKAYKCAGISNHEDYCVATDMVCDGFRDCPNGEDENACIGLSAPEGTPHGIGEVIVRVHGVWYSKCYHTQNHTKSELESICRELGFISGHAKQLPALRDPYPHNNVIIDTFSDVTLNNNTMIKLRNTHTPIARAIADDKKDCYPVFIECV